MKASRKTGGALTSLLIIAAILTYQHYHGGTATGNGLAEPEPPALDRQQDDVGRVWRAGQWLELQAHVERILRDDKEGARHQRFIVRVPDGRTLLVAHNIDVAPRIPVDTGDAVRLRGEYQPNERGGVIHWTHHDPQGQIDGGWIEHRGKRYK
jgi:hypothetical protein